MKNDDLADAVDSAIKDSGFMISGDPGNLMEMMR